MSVLLDLDARPVIAHRGGRAHAPENTLEAMHLGVAAGADARELDVHRSRDDEIVVIHDSTVDRTTDGSGAVAGMTLAELGALDAGSRFMKKHGGFAGHRCRIPTLESVLDSFPATPVIIEVKTPAASALTRTMIEKHGASGRCLVDSFYGEALEIFRGSGIPHGPSRDGVARLIVRSYLRTRWPAVQLDAICIPRRYRGFPLPVERISALLRAEGKPTHIWTVNDPAEAAYLWRLGVCGMVTDDVPALVAARRELRSNS